MCAVKKPKLCERKMGVVVRFVQRKIKAGQSPRKNERSCEEETGAKPSRSVAIFRTERCHSQERRRDSAECTGDNLVEVHGHVRLTRIRSKFWVFQGKCPNFGPNPGRLQELLSRQR